MSTARRGELIRNADDAGASCVRRAHGARSLLAPQLARWQGPALLAHNGAAFTDDNFASFSCIGGRKKTSQAWKTGSKMGASYALCRCRALLQAAGVIQSELCLRKVFYSCLCPGFRSLPPNCPKFCQVWSTKDFGSLEAPWCSEFGGLGGKLRVLASCSLVGQKEAEEEEVVNGVA